MYISQPRLWVDHQANKGGTMGKQSRASRREAGLSAAPGGTVAVYNECFSRLLRKQRRGQSRFLRAHRQELKAVHLNSLIS